MIWGYCRRMAQTILCQPFDPSSKKSKLGGWSTTPWAATPAAAHQRCSRERLRIPSLSRLTKRAHWCGGHRWSRQRIWRGQTSLPTSCIRHWKGPPWSLPPDSKIQKRFCCDCFVSIQGLIGSHYQGSTLKSKTLKSLLSEFWLVTVRVYTRCNTCIWHITTLINISTMPFIMIIST